MNDWTSDPPPMTVSELQAIMQASGYTTQEKLAQRLGVERQTVWRWLTGRTEIPKVKTRALRTLTEPNEAPTQENE